MPRGRALLLVALLVAALPVLDAAAQNSRETERRLNPYALRLDEGVWYVVGHDLDRDATRTFRVARIRSDIRFATRRERDFRQPAEFDVDAHRVARPWQIGEQVGVATIATTWLQNNPAHHTVIQVLAETGFSAFLAEHPLDRATFTEAVRLATTIKPGYHTVLSEPGAVARLQEYISEDSIWDGFLV